MTEQRATSTKRTSGRGQVDDESQQRSTSDRGYGWRYQKLRARLRDGVDVCPCRSTNDCSSACPCVDEPQPMYRDGRKNVDRRSLQCDHVVPLGVSGRRHVTQLSDLRLALGACNMSRGDGTQARAVDRDGYPKTKPRQRGGTAGTVATLTHQRRRAATRLPRLAGCSGMAAVSVMTGT